MRASDLWKGAAVEICPFRSAETRESHAPFDGSTGIVDSVSRSGSRTKVWVDVKGEAKHRKGRRAFPAEALKLVEREG